MKTYLIPKKSGSSGYFHFRGFIPKDLIDHFDGVQSPVFGPPFKLVSGDAFSAPSAVLPKVQEVDNSEQNVV